MQKSIAIVRATFVQVNCDAYIVIISIHVYIVICTRVHKNPRTVLTGSDIARMCILLASVVCFIAICMNDKRLNFAPTRSLFIVCTALFDMLPSFLSL